MWAGILAEEIRKADLGMQIPLYPGSLRPRSDSFATSFPFFNSKLLSTLNENEAQATEAKLDNKPRPTSSTSDIKAIFDAPPTPQAYNYEPVAPSPAVAPGAFYAQPPATSTGADFQSRYYSAASTPPAQGSGAYPAPPDTFVPSHPSRLSEEMILPASSSKRDSEPIMDDKLKEMVRRGIVGHHLNARAQSLDISRQTATMSRASPDQVGHALSNLRL